jgi:microcystin degradation protein MlrC
MTNRRDFLKKISAAAFAATGTKMTGAILPYTQLVNIRPGGFTSRRIFIAGFAHETNTFHPIPTSKWQYLEMAQINIKALKEEDYKLVHGVNAFPVGGGLLLEQPCREAMDQVLESLKKALPVDAVFLKLHGAMFAEGVGHAETIFVGMVRKIVGDRIPIACTFDLHGNIPSLMGKYGDILVGLKTAPHTDMEETAEHAAGILSDTLLGKVKPVSYVLPVPFLVQGEKAMTTSEPFGSLVEEARKIERNGITGYREKILAATLFVGCAWTDAPATGMSVMITADGSVTAARAAAVNLATKIWDARHQFKYGCETAELEEGVERALAAPEKTVFLTDSGDNVTASTPGDLPIVLCHLLEKKAGSAVIASITDIAAMEKCFAAGVGSNLTLSIGATIEKRHGPPLVTDVKVIKLISEPRMAVIKTDNIEVVLVADSSTFLTRAQFEQCGINPLERKLVVLKMGYLFPDLAKIAPRYIMLLTPGAGDMRIEKLNYTRIRRPIFPLDPDIQFNPSDIRL